MATNQYAPLLDNSASSYAEDQAQSWMSGFNYQLGVGGYNLPDNTVIESPSLGIQNSYNNMANDYITGGSPQQAATSNFIQGVSGYTGSDNAGAIGDALGGAANIYNNSSPSTGASVLSGAAEGAAMGTKIMPGWGTAIGAVVGGIIGFFGSKSKKKAEKKAFEQKEQLAIAPYQQQQANYLQNQGLLQKAISNYSSGYRPGGYQYTNPLMASKSNQPFTFGQPTTTPSLPNFNTGPSNIVTGKYVDTTKGIPPIGSTNPAFQSPAQKGLLNPVTPPSYTGNKSIDAANVAKYKQDYINMINAQNQQRELDAMNNYASAYQPNGGGLVYG